MAKRASSGQQGKKHNPPPGFVRVFSSEKPGTGNHQLAWVGRPAWSPDGRFLAVGSGDARIFIWDTASGALTHVFKAIGLCVAVSWSHDGKWLAATGLGSIQLWDVNAGRVFRHIELAPQGETAFSVAWSPTSPILAIGTSLAVAIHDFSGHGPGATQLNDTHGQAAWVAWSHDGKWLASAGTDEFVRIWPADGRAATLTLQGHASSRGVAWSPDNRTLAVAYTDSTIGLWDFESGRLSDQLKGHTSSVSSVSFSCDESLLASQGTDSSVRLWRRDTLEQVATLPVKQTNMWPPGADFHPSRPLLATGSQDGIVEVWELDLPVLLAQAPLQPPAHYSNAKIALVGNTSVGKSGLGLVLAGEEFRATESTHGRHIWPLKNETVTLREGVPCIRETLLWDFAGQPGYRLLHQLHFHDVAVALVLFDSRSETEPFAGIPYWAQALNEATHGHPLKKFLVASRSDRGGPKVSQGRIDEVMRRYGFDGYFETSAKRGTGIEELLSSIFGAIQWEKLPRVSTNELFLATQKFLVEEKKKGLAIATEDELLGRFKQKRKKQDVTLEVFTTCLGSVEATGLIRRLAFGQQVLLQPELLDAYCAWMAFAARDEPDGLGALREQDALCGNFPMDEDRALKGRAEEKIVLLATAHEVVSRNIAYRQETQQGTMLVFPSELNTELPDYPGGYSLTVAFQFRGPISAIYATLAVTIINSLVFQKKQLFKNAALYVGPRNQVCGFAVEYPDKADDALGRLTVFFEQDTSKDVRLLFLRFVNQQLERHSLENTVQRQRIYHCDACNYTMPPDIVKLRIKRHETTVLCPGCAAHMPIDDLAEESERQDAQLEQLNVRAQAERERQTRLTVLDERRRESEFHVFLCHNSKDKPVVRQLADKLLEHGILAWLDEKGILAGERFPRKLEETIDQAGALAVLIGPQGMGRWQEMEYQAALQRSVEERDEQGRSRLRLIPVLLPGVGQTPELPLFLRGLHAIDLRKEGPENRDQVRKLVEAITTKQDLF